MLSNTSFLGDHTSRASQPPEFMGALQISVVAIAVMLVSYVAARWVANLALPKSTSEKIKHLFIWKTICLWVRFLSDTSFIYFANYTYADVPPSNTVSLWGDTARSYGAKFSEPGPFAAFWRANGMIDNRFQEPDQLLYLIMVCTLFIGTPVTLWTMILLLRERNLEAWCWTLVMGTMEVCVTFLYFGSCLVGTPSGKETKVSVPLAILWGLSYEGIEAWLVKVSIDAIVAHPKEEAERKTRLVKS